MVRRMLVPHSQGKETPAVCYALCAAPYSECLRAAAGWPLDPTGVPCSPYNTAAASQTSCPDLGLRYQALEQVLPYCQ